MSFQTFYKELESKPLEEQKRHLLNKLAEIKWKLKQNRRKRILKSFVISHNSYTSLGDRIVPTYRMPFLQRIKYRLLFPVSYRNYRKCRRMWRYL